MEKRGVESSRLNMELMLCHLMGLSRVELYTNFEKPLKKSEVEKLNSWVKRRTQKEPLQYILGSTEFLGLKINLNPSVLIPRPETEMIILEAEKRFSKDAEIEILDIGTGSGCLAVKLAKEYPNSKVYGIDIDPAALKTANENAKLNKTENVSFKQMNILEEKIDYKFDLVVSNPPYIPKNEIHELDKDVKDHEPVSALTDSADGLTFYRRFNKIFKEILKKDGKFLIEIGYGQYPQISEILESKHYKTEVLEDFSGIKRIIIGNLFSN